MLKPASFSMEGCQQLVMKCEPASTVLGSKACLAHSKLHLQLWVHLNHAQCQATAGHHASPVKEKKPSEHKSPAKKLLKGNVPTNIM
jgi:hypothetical protein